MRNYTSTQGTGAFALGPAVNGYTGFASALEVGDSFYYSAIGVDKPAEREVGRGTLQANGSITREPISGSVRSEHLPAGAQLTDMFTGSELGNVDDLHAFNLEIEGFSGRSLLVTPVNS